MTQQPRCLQVFTRLLQSHRRNFALLLILGFVATTVSYTSGIANEFARGSQTQSDEEDDDGQLRREGERLQDELGVFIVRGDRATFITKDGNQEFGGLENQNLERIVRKVNDNPSRLTWAVSGHVTEYRGTNYLLISHGVIKARGKTNPTSEVENAASISP